MFVGKDYPASNLAELKQSVQGRQEPLLYSVTAAGSALHVGGALVLHMLGIKGQAVPYRNSDQVVIDVSENRLPMGVHVWNSMAPFVQSGRIKVLAVLSERPFSAAPQIATADSQGLKGVDIYGWLGLFMAAGESDGTIQGYEGRLRAFFSDREFPDFISKLSYVPSFRDSRSSRSFVDAETRRYEKLMKELNISV